MAQRLATVFSGNSKAEKEMAKNGVKTLKKGGSKPAQPATVTPKYTAGIHAQEEERKRHGRMLVELQVKRRLQRE